MDRLYFDEHKNLVILLLSAARVDAPWHEDIASVRCSHYRCYVSMITLLEDCFGSDVAALHQSLRPKGGVVATALKVVTTSTVTITPPS
jgi:hypothetical protein